MILGDRRFLPGIASPRLTRAVAFLWPGVYEPVPRSRIHWPAGGAARLRVLAVTSARRRERPCVCGCAPCGRTLTLLLHADTGAGSLGRGATAFHWRETCHCPPGGRPVSVPAAGRAGSGFSRASPGLVTARPPAPLPALARPPASVKCCLTVGRASWGLCVPWQSSDRRHRRSCPGKGGRGAGGGRNEGPNVRLAVPPPPWPAPSSEARAVRAGPGALSLLSPGRQVCAHHALWPLQDPFLHVV